MGAVSISINEVIFILGAFGAFFLAIFWTLDVMDKKHLPNELEIMLDYAVPLTVWVVALLSYDVLRKRGYL